MKHRKDININATNENGNTIIHLIIHKNSLCLLQMIVSHFSYEIDFKIRNHEKLTVLELAISKKRNSIAKLLLKYQKPDKNSFLLAIQQELYEVAEIIYNKQEKIFSKNTEVNILIRRLFKIARELEKKNLEDKRILPLQDSMKVIKFNLIPILQPNENCKPERISSTLTFKTLKQFFKCSNCAHFLEASKSQKIFSCYNDHFVCIKCNTEPCYICENKQFARRFTIERILAKLFHKKLYSENIKD